MPELLSPAGDFTIFKSVIEQGADAVYFAGSLFGARAYAKNFSDEEVIEAIDFAHIYGKKAYLTVNTLLKNTEIEKYLYDYVKKFYYAGIDAILVQDIGVYYFLKKNFPGLSIHVSTQASVSSHYGVLFFKELHADRVVLSRELSIAEIKNIKQLTGMELEVFIHGAMCVSYSGKCLMSSMIGGRSGNRGRCAQPCRLNYGFEIDGEFVYPEGFPKGFAKSEWANKKLSSKSENAGNENTHEVYPLSMKDLCGIAEIPALIDAGVDSLKIEGRMKSKEYASGVTSAYRNFLDAYASDKNVINDRKYMKGISDYLLALGNRGNFSSSYFYQRSSKDMISFRDSSLHTGEVDGTYLGSVPRKNNINIVFKASISKGIFLFMALERDRNCQAAYTSDKVYKAEKRAVTKEEIKEKLSEISDTPFEIASIDIDIEDGIFIPMSIIKSLRRAAVSNLEDSILTEWEIKASEKNETGEKSAANDNAEPDDIRIAAQTEENEDVDKKEKYFFSCLFENQFNELLKNDKVQNIIIPASLFLSLYRNNLSVSEKNIFIDLPSVIRDDDNESLKRVMEEASGLENIKGFFASSYDGLYLLKEEGIEKEKVFLSPEVYIFNNYSAKALKTLGYKNLSVPYELNENELRHMDLSGFMMTIYGKTPLMHLEDCIYRNTEGCHRADFMESIPGNGSAGKKSEFHRRKAYYIDRLGKKFFDAETCLFCQNTLYNTVPTMLFNDLENIRALHIKDLRVDFTDESEQYMSKIFSYIFSLSHEKGYNTKDTEFLRNTTRGHFHRGVE